MATNISAEYTGHGPDGQSSTITKSGISLADVVVNTTPNAVGGWNTATVTADVARSHPLTRASHGVPDGVYEKCAPATFRKKTDNR